jgi:hypothetical protein
VRDDQPLDDVGIVLMSAGRVRPAQLDDPRATFVTKPFGVYEMLDAIDLVSARADD